ncbi:MAG: hypothetical protein KAT25_09245 [Sulfuriflexus sp.]|nr:hypothetical protein [Sulfuriflexus sp.]
MFNPSEVPKDTHSVEVREESYGFTLAHRCNSRILYVATYHNHNDAMRQANRIADQEQADGHEVIMVTDAHIS